MDRRFFLKTGTAALGGFVVAGCGTSRDDTAASGADTEASVDDVTMDQVGVQLYTLRTLMNEDADGTLAQLADAGYGIVETHDLYGNEAAAFRQMLDRHGLQAPAGHYGLDALRGDQLAPTLEIAQTLGHRYVVTPWIDEQERASLDGYRARAEEFNEIGAAVQDAGMRFGYHNHAFEFEAMEGQVPFDVLLTETDPELVDMELDIFWVVEGGYDPLAYFEEYPGRFPLWHVKDRTADGEMVDVGDGVIDFGELFEHAEQSGLHYAIVEHDEPAEPLASVRSSYDHLTGMLG